MNIIPLGDHCILSMVLKEINFRKFAYPFDWITKHEQLYDTNILYNISIIKELMKTYNTKQITELYIGDSLNEKNNININNNLWFPHEKECETIDDMFKKYQRRFDRLYNHIKNEKNIFIMITRHYYIKQKYFDYIIETLLKYNKENKIIFISGIEHLYFNEKKYENKIIYKYILYDIKKFYKYDYTHFRPQVKDYLKKILKFILKK